MARDPRCRAFLAYSFDQTFNVVPSKHRPLDRRNVTRFKIHSLVKGVFRVKPNYIEGVINDNPMYATVLVGRDLELPAVITSMLFVKPLKPIGPGRR